MAITPKPIAPQPKTATFDPARNVVYELDNNFAREPMIRTDSGLFDDSTPCSGDTASKQANAIKTCLGVHSNN